MIFWMNRNFIGLETFFWQKLNEFMVLTGMYLLLFFAVLSQTLVNGKFQRFLLETETIKFHDFVWLLMVSMTLKFFVWKF